MNDGGAGSRAVVSLSAGDVRVTNVLSFDVEEYFQVHAFERVISSESWSSYPSRVVGSTRRILELLREYRVQATFFVLGWVADRQPRLVEEIATDGHEVATHGYLHELVYRLTPEEFNRDLEASQIAIQRALGADVVSGYRAPGFSITKESLWALDVLARSGLAYDSSVFPLSAHDRYGIPGAHRFVHRLPNGLWEVPASTVKIAKLNMPVAGGGYFRLYPLWLTTQAVHRLNADGQPAVVYLHPWEFDPDQPRVAGASHLSRYRHYTNLSTTENKLRALLDRFSFTSIRNVLLKRADAVP